MSNLLVVLCGNRDAQPVVNSGSLYLIWPRPAKSRCPCACSPKLYDAIAAWAEDDFRSVNGQIEYLLTECVRQRKKNGKYVSDQIDVPPELDPADFRRFLR